MSNPENKERPNRSETAPPKQVDRAKVAAGLGKSAAQATVKKN